MVSIMRFTIVVLAACGLGACSSGGGTGGRESSQEAAVLANSAPAEALTTKGGRAAADSCQEGALVADSAGLALVEEYLRRDALGEFIRASEWLSEVTYRASHGGDRMSIISGYEIVAAETRCDTTRITVHYDVIGGCCNHGPPPEYKPEFFLTQDSVAVWTFTVVNIEEGPRLTRGLFDPHMSGRAVLELNFDDEEFRRALEEVLRRKGGL
jgi:hypothetical protein